MFTYRINVEDTRVDINNLILNKLSLRQFTKQLTGITIWISNAPYVGLLTL